MTNLQDLSFLKTMILEQVILPVIAGKEAEFKAAFAEAESIIASMSGYRGHTLQQCMEEPNQFLLLVNWATLEAHTVGFRGSAEYQQWKALLHHFYEPFPTVYHFEPVSGTISLS